MALTRVVRDWWAAYRCCAGVVVPTGFFGRHTVYAANDDGIVAVQALEQGHIGSGYVPTDGGYIGSKRWCPTGIGGKACQESGKDCSIHNYCMAWDVEYQYNLYIRSHVTEADFAEDWFPWVCKYTLAQVRAIESIRNTTGEIMFRWLGWAIGDFMHWQINVPPTRMTVDWNTVPGHDVVIPEGSATVFIVEGQRDDSSKREFYVESWQIYLAELEGYPYTDGSTGGVIGQAGMNRGVYDGATTALVAEHTDTNGTGIGPRESHQISDAILDLRSFEFGDADAIHRGDTVVLN